MIKAVLLFCLVPGIVLFTTWVNNQGKAESASPIGLSTNVDIGKPSDDGILPMTVTNLPPLDYQRGVNDALTEIMLLDLEQKRTSTSRTWGAMADIVRERLGVKKETK